MSWNCDATLHVGISWLRDTDLGRCSSNMNVRADVGTACERSFLCALLLRAHERILTRRLVCQSELPKGRQHRKECLFCPKMCSILSVVDVSIRAFTAQMFWDYEDRTLCCIELNTKQVYFQEVWRNCSSCK